MIDQRSKQLALVRFGRVPEVARCVVGDSFDVQRADEVVIRTHRGLELGTVLEVLKPSREPDADTPEPEFQVLRLANSEDKAHKQRIEQRVRSEFPNWNHRISDWGLDLQLIDMDWTLEDQKPILYVLNERGPECTKLALQAAATGLGIVEVQPVGAEGPITIPASGGGGGCGSCGNHSH